MNNKKRTKDIVLKLELYRWWKQQAIWIEIKTKEKRRNKFRLARVHLVAFLIALLFTMQSNIMSIQRKQYPVIASTKPDILREAVSKYIDHFYPK